MVNNALQSLWRDTLTVTEFRESTAPNGSTAFEEFTAYSDIPCRLSFVSTRHVNQNAFDARISYTAKIFLAPDIIIKPGSRITVLRASRVFHFSQSGSPAVYSNHQEVPLAPLQTRA